MSKLSKWFGNQEKDKQFKSWTVICDSEFLIRSLNEKHKMSGEQNICDPQNTNQPNEKTVDENSKQSVRVKVWQILEKNKLVNFPRPVFGRVPNFKGADKAAAKLLELEEFKNAKRVEVNPDKPLETARALVIDNDKILYVPPRKLQEGFLKKISFCTEDKPKNVKQTVTRWGIEALGKPIDFGEDLQIDLLIVGSVAVSKEGHRIGKGKGYADLEYAILKEMKAVNDDTTIVTIVHETQVFDSLPIDIFKKHDVPIDYILTSSEIIKVEKKLPRPQGIYWDLLTSKDLVLKPVLQKIKEVHSSVGRDTTLKEVDPEEENQEKRKMQKNRRSFQNGSKSDRSTDESGIVDSTNSQRPPRRRFFNRSKPAKETNENEDPGNKENEAAQPIRNKPRQFRRNSRRNQLDFSVVVSNIDRNVRVRHLKEVLIDHGIKPNNITWRGYKGFCYLHYIKPLKKGEDNVSKETPFAVENVVGILQSLKLNNESSNSLDVKIMDRITRIETTDVTAV